MNQASIEQALLGQLTLIAVKSNERLDSTMAAVLGFLVGGEIDNLGAPTTCVLLAIPVQTKEAERLRGWFVDTTSKVGWRAPGDCHQGRCVQQTCLFWLPKHSRRARGRMMACDLGKLACPPVRQE